MGVSMGVRMPLSLHVYVYVCEREYVCMCVCACESKRQELTWAGAVHFERQQLQKKGGSGRAGRVSE